MKKLMWLVVAVLPLGLIGCGGGGADGLMKDSIGVMNDMAAALESVKDDASADAAVKKIKDLATKLGEISKKSKELKLSADEEKKLQEKYKGEMEKAQKRMQDAMVQAVKNAPKKAGDLAAAMASVADAAKP